MPTVTYDAQSFLVDAKRLWLTGCVLEYARVPRDEWAERLHAASLCGFNAVLTSVPWMFHEPRQGQHHFEAQHDVRHFLELAQRTGLYVVLKLGPFVGGSFDAGGIPTWLHRRDDVDLRAASGPFLEACSKHFSAIADQVKDLQATAPGAGNPLLAVQVETNWTCGDDAAAVSYLGELARYVREAGFNVPALNANNLWQGLEGEIDTWVGNKQMLATLRQLSVVVPDKPKIISSFDVSDHAAWGGAPIAPPHPLAVQRRLGEILAGGGQFFVDPLSQGVPMGPARGREPGGAFAGDDPREVLFPTSSPGGASPLDEAGAPAEAFGPVRRMAMFSSQFSRIFAARNAEHHPTCLDPDVEAVGKDNRFFVVDTQGQHGRAAFVFAEPPKPGEKAPTKPRAASLLLPRGEPLHVSLGTQAVAWVLFDYHLAGRTVLTYSSLNALAALDTIFVCFGAPGAEGEVAINGSPLRVTVPSGKDPLVVRHEGAVIVVCSETTADTCYVAADAVYVGIAGLTHEGDLLPLPGAKHAWKITKGSVTGEPAEKVAMQAKLPAKSTPKALPLEPWKVAAAEDYSGGSSPRYAAIEGPAELTDLGTPYGYGWYRIEMKSSSAKKLKLSMPHLADRAQFFLDGESVGVYGRGPGAEAGPLVVPLKKGTRVLTALVDNMGRPSGGADIDEAKGLFGHLFETTAVKPGKPKIEIADPVDLLGWRSPLWRLRPGDGTGPERLTWAFMHRKKSPIILRIGHLPHRVLLLVNGEPVDILEQGTSPTLVFTSEQLKKGNNAFQFALIDETADDARSLKELVPLVSFEEGSTNATEKSAWAFAKWEPPAPTAFTDPSKSMLTSTASCPTWWRSRFELPVEAASVPVFLDASGLTKGEIFINGRHVCRYFVAERAGASAPPVGPQTRYLLPRPWLEPGSVNEVMVFDEHGGNPSKASVTADATRRVLGRPLA
ncbi:MAG: beta-galactosidase [Planctomycetota bacterium]